MSLLFKLYSQKYLIYMKLKIFNSNKWHSLLLSYNSYHATTIFIKNPILNKYKQNAI
jgi:hypothetical protein